jgi:hypothetical protein
VPTQSLTYGLVSAPAGVAASIRVRHATLCERPRDYGVDRLLAGRVGRRNTGRRDQQRQGDHHGVDASHSNFLFSGVIGATTFRVRSPGTLHRVI